MVAVQLYLISTISICSFAVVKTERERDGSCDPPPRVEHGLILEKYQRKFVSGTELSIKCTEMYEVDGDNVISCDGGTWTSVPRCIRRLESTKVLAEKLDRGRYDQCGQLPIVENGDFIGDLTQGEVRYQCQRYYKLVGPERVICRNGKWTDPPTCLSPCALSEAILSKNYFHWPGHTVYIEEGKEEWLRCQRYGYCRGKCSNGQVQILYNCGC